MIGNLPLVSGIAVPDLLAIASKRGFWLPQQASTVAADTDNLFFFIYWLSIVFFALIVGAMVLFVVKFRRKKNVPETSSAIEGNTKLEVAWAVIPGILLIAIFVWGFRGWIALAVPPGEAIEIQVRAKKWLWSFDYRGTNINGVDEITVPVDTPVKLIMSSEDVIHSFFVPAFRVKKDIVPNRYSVLWFTPTKLGEFDVLCTEYCGNGHSRMLSKVTVVTRDEYDKWMTRGGLPEGVEGKALGEYLFKAKGCKTCHSITTDRMGLPCPPLGGKYGSQEQLVTGEMQQIDDNYIRESIMKPNAKVVKGYAPVMPTFAGQIDDKQMDALIQYIASLK